MQKLTIILAILFQLACAKAQDKIDAAQLETLVKAGDIQLVDLRTPTELEKTGKIAGAQHINFNAPDFKEKMAALDEQKPLIIYCAAGGRSGKAIGILKEMGFATIYDYSGGMNDWKAKGKATVAGQ
jgi:rhodanese-related sulfurtransferase